MFKKVFPLSLILAIRFFGLFVVLPVIAAYAISMHGATPFLIGVAVGGYALTQMIFQVPFGMMSDKIGRKATILIGTVIFIAGSIVCSLSDTIYGLLLGRLLQGVGAIAAVISAMIADLVDEEIRTKAMAIMGGSIAIAFSVAMMAGPLVSASFGVGFLFDIAAFLALLSLVILYFYVPNPPKVRYTQNQKINLATIAKNFKLNVMNATNFLQKAFMTIAFMFIPIVLVKDFFWLKEELYKVYIPSVIVGIFAMGFVGAFAQKRGYFIQSLVFGVVFFVIAFLLMAFGTSSAIFIIGAMLFFIGFNIHEPIMQSLASRYCKYYERGTALGIFNSYGYLGTFVGGIFGALFLNSDSHTMVIIIAGVSAAWIILLLQLENPAQVQNLYIPLAQLTKDYVTILDFEKGIDEFYVNETEQILIVRFNQKQISKETLTSLIQKI